jgi:ATP synthase protein I
VALRRKDLRQARTWLDVSIVGIQFPVAIGLGYLWGRWMDRYLGTTPWLTIVFALFGIVAGFVNLFRITAAAGRAEQREADERAEDERDRSQEDGDADHQR